MASSHPGGNPNGVPPPSGPAPGPPVAVGSASPGPAVGNGPHSGFKRRLHEQLLSALTTDRVERASEQQARAELTHLAAELSAQVSEALSLTDQEKVVEQVLDEVFGYGPLAPLMRDHEISEILINGPRQLFIEKRGQLQACDVAFRDEHHLLEVVRRMLAWTGRRIDEKTPTVDARLADGSRLNAVIKPAALNGPLVSIRRIGMRPLTVEDLLTNESVTSEMLEFLSACVKSRINIIVSGGTGSGKTTLLNALSRYIRTTERIVTIEDTAELQLQQPHVAKMEAQPVDLEGEGAVSVHDLVKNSLRMRPDRIIVGECRGAEALDMLQAMNTGHEGSLTTIHANSTREALTRVELMIGLAGIDIPVQAIRKLVASSVNLIVQVSRLPGGKRKVVTISEITGMEGDVVSMHDIFEYSQTGVDKDYVVEGYFRATGLRPQCLQKLNLRGANLPQGLFNERRLQTMKNRGLVR
jgi:pilus assembly protein CpaF